MHIILHLIGKVVLVLRRITTNIKLLVGCSSYILQKLYQRLELERDRVNQLNRQRQREHEVRFDITKCFAPMPRFPFEATNAFFKAFERIAAERDRPLSEWGDVS